jgi:hypothetical protein
LAYFYVFCRLISRSALAPGSGTIDLENRTLARSG